ncbi:hypothetical protein RRG08_059746 [Elysia crispata]|uniref:Major facilitator superfamily (MFS) profile domain-containing protein n=1 Tax=Elysia crispata TaxID=231223 RepID=A0AAE0Y5I1_9GAST|nr:hypothetical protein RRG08_059746 [Elysia crispata]
MATPDDVLQQVGVCGPFQILLVLAIAPGTHKYRTSTLVTEWSLVCDQGWALNVIFMVQMVGVVLGASLIGHQGDRVRQRTRLFCMVKIYISFTLLAESSKSWEITVRFFIGITVGGILATGNLDTGEFSMARS